MPSPRVSLPSSPEESNRGGLLDSWRAPRSSSGRNTPYSQNRTTAFRDEIIHNLRKIGEKTIKTFMKLSVIQKILVVLAFVAATVFGILFLIFSERIFGWLQPLAERWKNTTGGWIILWLITFAVGFPPIIGYSTCCTTAGFVYGAWEGWFIVATATIIGSLCSFLVSRTVLRKYVERMVANDKRFAALVLTLKQDGLKLLCMIRLCPLPYSLSNGALATFPTIQPLMFMLATAIITPKLMIPVFIGSRLAAIAKNKEQMSTGTKVINWISIAGGVTLGTFTAWYIYRKTMARARELEQEEVDSVRGAAWRPGNVPPRRFSDDPEAQAAVESLAQDSDVIDYFDETPPRSAYRDQHSAGDGNRDDNDNDSDIFARSESEDEQMPIGLKKTTSKK